MNLEVLVHSTLVLFSHDTYPYYFFAALSKDLYAEHEREASHRQQNSPEEPDGETAFWQGVHLVREGRSVTSVNMIYVGSCCFGVDDYALDFTLFEEQRQRSNTSVETWFISTVFRVSVR